MAKVVLPEEHTAEVLRLYCHEAYNGDSIRNYLYADGVAFLPLNATKLNKVASLLHEEIIDDRSFGKPVSEPYTLNPAFTFRPHQTIPSKDLVEFCRSHLYAVLRAPCSCGKTVVLTYAAGMIGRKTLVLVDMGSLVSQWQEAFQIVWNKSVHILDKEVDSFGDVTIATFQFLHRNPSIVKRIKDEFGMLLVDEFHTAAAGTYRNVLFRLNNRYRIGTSATVMRKGFTNEVLTDLIADVSVEMVDEHAQVPSITFVPTRVNFEYDTPDMFTKICGGLADSDVRNGVILDLIREAVAAKRKILVIGITIVQLKYLHFALSKFCSAVLYCGTTSMNQDRKLRSDLAEGLIDVILTVKKADKGLDLPMLDTLVLAKPSNNEASVIQLVGRIVRPVEGKPVPMVYDLADSGSLAGTFARNRLRWYKKQGYVLGEQDYFFVDNR